MRFADHDAVRDEFELFCRIALDDTLRTAVEAIPFDQLGLEPDAVRCPRELRDRTVNIEAEVLDLVGDVEQMLQLEFDLDRFVRLRTFLRRFSTEQVRTLRASMKT